MHHFRRPALLVLAFILGTAGPLAAQSARVGGTVKTEEGQAIKGATITAENPLSAPNTFTATTDERGRFSMIGLRSGTWAFTAAAPGRAPSQISVRVQTLGINTPMDFRLAVGASAPTLGALVGVDSKQLQRDLMQAEALFNSEKYELAAEAYEEIAEKVPALSSVQIQIGHSYRLRKDFPKAQAVYEEVLKGHPNNMGAKVGIGLTYLDQGNFDAAENALAAVADDSDASREVFYTMAEVKAARNQPDEAVVWYEKALTADPAWAKPHYKMGLAALKKGDKETAAQRFEKALEVEPDSPEAAEAKTAMEQLQQ